MSSLIVNMHYLQKKSFWLASVLLIIFFIVSFLMSTSYTEQSFGFISMVGLFFGLVLQRTRFCFYCIFTDFFDKRDSQGIIGILVALIIGTLGYFAVFGAFIPNPDGVQLPPDAHISAVSWILPFSALIFGLGMAFAGSCISAQLYRFGEGLLTAPIAIVGVIVGFALGFLSWNSLYLKFIYSAKPLWLPNIFGYAGALLLQLGLLTALILVFLFFHRPVQSRIKSAVLNVANTVNIDHEQAVTQQSVNRKCVETKSLDDFWQALFVLRWPTWLGGLIIGSLATIAYFRVGALGVTAEIGSIARTLLNFAWPVDRLEGLERLTGCMTVIKDSLLSKNGVFVLSLMVGSLIAALYAGQFKFQSTSLKGILRIFIGGVLMGWGAMVSLGCTVGVLLSGIMAGAISGWLFAVFCFGGAWLGWRIRQQWH